MDVIKKRLPILDEKGRPSAYPTYASQVFREDGTPLEQGGVLQGLKPLDVYPVGSIYLSVSGISPASLFGGTWEQLKDVFLLGAGGSYAVASVGGEAAHTLTANEMPRHAHGYEICHASGSSNYWYPFVWLQTEPMNTGEYRWTTESGNSLAHNNMPPYYAVNMWQRMA